MYTQFGVMKDAINDSQQVSFFWVMESEALLQWGPR